MQFMAIEQHISYIGPLVHREVEEPRTILTDELIARFIPIGLGLAEKTSIIDLRPFPKSTPVIKARRWQYSKTPNPEWEAALDSLKYEERVEIMSITGRMMYLFTNVAEARTATWENIMFSAEVRGIAWPRTAFIKMVFANENSSEVYSVNTPPSKLWAKC